MWADTFGLWYRDQGFLIWWSLIVFMLESFITLLYVTSLWNHKILISNNQSVSCDWASLGKAFYWSLVQAAMWEEPFPLNTYKVPDVVRSFSTFTIETSLRGRHHYPSFTHVEIEVMWRLRLELSHWAIREGI